MIQSSVKFEFFVHGCQIRRKRVVDQDVFCRNLSTDPSEKVFGRNLERTACSGCKGIQKLFVIGRKKNQNFIIFRKVFGLPDTAAEIVLIFRSRSKLLHPVFNFCKKCFL